MRCLVLSPCNLSCSSTSCISSELEVSFKGLARFKFNILMSICHWWCHVTRISSHQSQDLVSKYYPIMLFKQNLTDSRCGVENEEGEPYYRKHRTAQILIVHVKRYNSNLRGTHWSNLGHFEHQNEWLQLIKIHWIYKSILVNTQP